MCNSDDVYYQNGAVIEVLGKQLLMIYPDNVENNFAALENGDMVINWCNALENYKKFINKDTKYEFKITIYGKMVGLVSFSNFTNLYSFVYSIDNKQMKIEWAKLLRLAKDEKYPMKVIINNKNNIYHKIAKN